MKAWQAVLIFFGLFIFFMGFAAWIEARVTPGQMFAVKKAYTTIPLAEDPAQDPWDIRPCRIAPGGHIFILEERTTFTLSSISRKPTRQVGIFASTKHGSSSARNRSRK